jgi:hypothetical protein
MHKMFDPVGRRRPDVHDGTAPSWAAAARDRLSRFAALLVAPPR